jgi:PST family polysaccharide transporter
MSNLNYTIRKSICANFIGRYSNTLVQLIVTAVLARLLGPADFGVIAVLSVLVTFFSFISEMGLGPAIIQFELKHEQQSALFWLTMFVGSVLSMVFVFGGPMLASFYHEPRYIPIAKILAFNIAFSCWGIVPFALLRKRLKFKEVAMVEIASAILSGCVGIAAAYANFGVFALALKGASYACAMSAFSIAASGFNPFRLPIFRGMARILSFSLYQFFSNLTSYLTRNVDKLIVGRLMGSNALGLYDMSYRLMMLPNANLTQIISPALQPIYAAHQHDKSTIFSSYQTVIRALLIAGGFAGIGCFLCANEIIFLAYGRKWALAAPIFSILSLSIAIQVILATVGAIFQAIGRPDLLSFSGTLSAVCSIGAMVMGALSGSLTVFAWLVSASFVVNGLMNFFILARRGFGTSLFSLFRPSLGCMSGIVVMLAASAAVRLTVNAFEFNPFLLAAKIVGVTGAYAAILYVTGDLQFLLSTLSRQSTRVSVRKSNTGPVGDTI